jgi:hypothetical protein
LRQSYLNHLKLARFDTRQFEKRTVSDITAIAPSSALLKLKDMLLDACCSRARTHNHVAKSV